MSSGRDALHAAIAAAHASASPACRIAAVTAAHSAVYEEARLAGDLTCGSIRRLGSVRRRRPTTSARWIRCRREYPDDPLFKVGGARIALDGPVDRREAALLEPYDLKARDECRARPAIEPDTLNKLVRMLDGRGWQVTLDAFGDRAVRMALDAFEHAERSNPEPARGRRHRIGHPALTTRTISGSRGSARSPLLRPSEAIRSRAAWTPGVRTLGDDRTIAGVAAASISRGTGNSHSRPAGLPRRRIPLAGNSGCSDPVGRHRPRRSVEPCRSGHA